MSRGLLGPWSSLGVRTVGLATPAQVLLGPSNIPGKLLPGLASLAFSDWAFGQSTGILTAHCSHPAGLLSWCRSHLLTESHSDHAIKLHSTSFLFPHCTYLLQAYLHSVFIYLLSPLQEGRDFLVHIVHYCMNGSKYAYI